MRSAAALAGIAIGAALCAAPRTAPAEAEPTARWDYEVVVAPALDRLSVRLCFEAFAPRRLVRVAGGDLEGIAPAAGEPEAAGFSAEAGAWTLAAPSAARCVSYEVELSAALARGSRPQDGTVVTEAGRWLLRPAAIPEDLRATVRFRLPPGASVSTPWAPLPAAGPGAAAFALDPTTWAFVGHVALGAGLAQEEIAAAGARLSLTLLPGALRTTPAGRRRWLEAATAAVGAIYGPPPGRFPRDRVQVLVRPAGGRGGDPVPFGSSWQGGGAALQLLLAREASDDEILGEWVAVHELVHLAMPPISHEDAWLSEGFATYYQEVLRARAGFLEPLAAWRALDDGFRRGRRDEGDAPLAEESRRMRETHRFLRVYWSGAAVALLLDVELRRASQGRQTLDGAMRVLTERHGGEARFLPAAEAVADVDAWAGRPAFATLADAALRAVEMPSLDEAYAWLGLDRDGDGALRERDDAPGAAARRAIMARTPGARPSPSGPFEPQ